MKKLLIALAAVALIGMTSCKKEPMPEPEKEKGGEPGSIFSGKQDPYTGNFWDINEGPKTDLDYEDLP